MHNDAAPKRQLSLFDTTSIIVGIVVGGGLYETIPRVAANTADTASLYGLWIIGGLFALFGSMCYAELATAYPCDGGEYVYLTRAFGKRLGFLYSWTQFWIIRPASVGAIAYIYGGYIHRIAPLGKLDFSIALHAVAAVVGISLLNFLGLREGKWTQNALTGAKVAGLLLLAVGCLLSPAVESSAISGGSADTPATYDGSLSLALIFVMFAYGGWNDMPLVAAEVRDPNKNLSRSLILGSLGIAAVYLLVNWAFVHLLGFSAVQSSSTVGAAALDRVLGRFGEAAFSLLVAISCLGAIQGMLFTGARIYYVTGVDHPLFAWLGRWDERSQSPQRAWLVQALLTLLLTAGVGWRGGQQGFDRALAISAAPFWFFIVLSIAALPILRYRDAATERPYRVPGYPFIPLIFFSISAWMFWSSIDYARHTALREAQGALILVLVGLVVGHFSSQRLGSHRSA